MQSMQLWTLQYSVQHIDSYLGATSRRYARLIFHSLDSIQSQTQVKLEGSKKGTSMNDAHLTLYIADDRVETMKWHVQFTTTSRCTSARYFHDVEGSNLMTCTAIVSFKLKVSISKAFTEYQNRPLWAWESYKVVERRWKDKIKIRIHKFVSSPWLTESTFSSVLCSWTEFQVQAANVEYLLQTQPLETKCSRSNGLSLSARIRDRGC